jgi:hypothetical protein
MSRPFKEVENAFRVLRGRFRDNEISRREFIDQLKKLRLRDDRGRFWMIGAQTGRWYYFEGKEWVQSDPPADVPKKLRCPACGSENEGGAERCGRCGEDLGQKESVCPGCGTRLESPFQKCPVCSREAEAAAYAEEALFKGRETGQDGLILKRLGPLSVFLLGGGTGLVLGVVAGAFAGVSGWFSGVAVRLPDFLSTLHGTLMGGIMFGVFGGVLGFASVGALGYLLALLFNLIASVTGGITVAVETPEERTEEKGK